MELLDHNFEKAALLSLPPHARDVAEHLLEVSALDQLITMQQNNKPDYKLLQSFNAPYKIWLDIVNAALLAKSTNFILNPDFSKEELLYLMKVGCSSINRPLNVYSIKEVVEMSHEDYPIFCNWLTQMVKQLKGTNP